jgi:diguanylate cyclase (GGDEF)-like protein/hemerythrin-like metal-binding protein
MAKRSIEPASAVADVRAKASDASTALAALGEIDGALVGVRDHDGVYRFANRNLEQLYRIASGALVGKTDAPFVSTEFAATLRARDLAAASGGSSVPSLEERVIDGRTVLLACLRFPVVHGPEQAVCTGFVAFALAEGNEAEASPPIDNPYARIRTLTRTVEEMRKRLATDELTGSWARTRIAEAGRQEAYRRDRYGHPASLVFLDLDRFKQINDKHGHQVGDDVLRDVCQLMRRFTRATDMLGRWGGEEFVIVLPHTGIVSARLFAEKLRGAVEAYDFALGRPVTASFGVAECLEGEEWESWVARADAAMYRAKRAGRNRVVVDAPLPQGGKLAESVTAGIVSLVWRDTYESGEETLDLQHRALFATANELLFVATDESRQSESLALLASLVRDCAEHFRSEEALLEQLRYPDLHRHRLRHRSLLRKARELYARCDAGDMPLANLLTFVVGDLVARHILAEDRKYFALFALPRQAPDAPPGSEPDGAGGKPSRPGKAAGAVRRRRGGRPAPETASGTEPGAAPDRAPINRP